VRRHARPSAHLLGTWLVRTARSRTEPWGVVVAPRGRRVVVFGFTIAQAGIVEIDVVADCQPRYRAGARASCSFGPMTAMSHLGQTQTSVTPSIRMVVGAGVLLGHC